MANPERDLALYVYENVTLPGWVGWVVGTIPFLQHDPQAMVLYVYENVTV